MDDESTLDTVRRAVYPPGESWSGLAQVTTFVGYRPKKTGGMKEVTIEVHDGRHGAVGGRCRVIARDEDGPWRHRATAMSGLMLRLPLFIGTTLTATYRLTTPRPST